MVSRQRHSILMVFGVVAICGSVQAFMPNFFNTRNYYRTFMESQAKMAVAKQRENDSVQIRCGPTESVSVSEWDWQNCIFDSTTPFKDPLRSEFSRPLCISKFCNQKELLIEEAPSANPFPQPHFEPFQQPHFDQHFPFH